MAEIIELYCSTDIEADGKSPGLANMLSFGTAIYDIEKKLHGTFSANLTLLENVEPHPDTKKFWDENPEAYAATRINVRNPADAMRSYVNYIEGIAKNLSKSAKAPVKLLFVGYPAAYDFKWIDYYCNR